MSNERKLTSIQIGDIEKLLNEYKEDQLPDAKLAFSDQAEIASGFEMFIKWLKEKYE